MTHDFTLILTELRDFDDATMDAVFEAGCDDCTLHRRGPHVAASFSREAPSMDEAVSDAIKALMPVNKGVPPWRLIRT